MSRSEVELQSNNGRSFHAYLAVPSQRAAPGVVVLQEIFGVNASIRRVCNTLAEHGFNAIAPDLFWRQSPGVQLDSDNESDRSKAFNFVQGMDERGAIEDAMVALR